MELSILAMEKKVPDRPFETEACVLIEDFARILDF